MKYESLTSRQLISFARSSVGAPVVLPPIADGVTILNGSISAVRQQVGELKRREAFPGPRILLLEQETGPNNLPLKSGRAQAIILSGQDVATFSQTRNQGYLPDKMKPVRGKRLRKLLYWLLPPLKRHHDRREAKAAAHHRSDMVEKIKAYAAEKRGLAFPPALFPPDKDAVHASRMTFFTVK